MKVRVNTIYRYNPKVPKHFRTCPGDTLRPSQLVKVIDAPGAPKANMGQCYVADPETGKVCMVLTSSLGPEFMRKEYGPSDFQRMIRGLTEAAKLIAAEEEIKRDQMELFDKMKTEDSKYTN